MPLSLSRLDRIRVIEEATGLEGRVAEKAERHRPQAEAELRGRLGAEALESRAEAIRELSAEAQAQTALGRAWALLTVAAALPMLGLRPTEKGGLIGAVGFERDRKELLSQKSVGAVAEALREQARELVPDEAGGSDAGDEDPVYHV